MSVQDFVKKPLEVQAVQFVDNMSAKEIVDWIEGTSGGNTVNVVTERAHSGEMFVKAIVISTLEGNMRADLNDWVIRGIKREFYPCKPDIFDKTYDPKEDS